MNYYQHHIGDFIRDTARLSDAQCMAYLRMIWMYYDTEQPLESDIDALAFRIGANASDVHQIIRHFFFEHEGKLHHSRCDKEIAKHNDAKANHWGRKLPNWRRCSIQAARNAAKISATPQWLTKQQKADIAKVYLDAAMLTKQTGVKHEVDHVIPLRGETACGLHVAWNLRAIPAHKNRLKSNSISE